MHIAKVTSTVNMQWNLAEELKFDRLMRYGKAYLAARAEQPITTVQSEHCFDRIRLESLKAVVPECTISDMIEACPSL